MFLPNKTYKRKELHVKYGGQKQGGISTPAKHNFIMLFTGDQGQQYGYHDELVSDNIYMYTGEGQIGDMEFKKGNLAIRDHTRNGKDLFLFKYVKKGTGNVQYLGQMTCTGYQEHPGPDKNGEMRRIIVFELTHSDDVNASNLIPLEREEEVVAAIENLSLPTLRERALSSSTAGRTPTERKSLVQYKSQCIRVYVLKRANGICEACGSTVPFITSTGRPYLEPHHIRRLSDGGPDDPRFVIGVYPNCHRQAHYGKTKIEFNQQLMKIISIKEENIIQ